MSVAVLLLYFLLFGHSNAKNDGNCNIELIGPSQWDPLFSLNINDTDEEIFQSTYKGNLEITNCSHEYFDITNDATRFIIKTNKNFVSFDKDTEKQSQPFAYIPVFSCQMKCDDGTSTLQISITVKDTNNHKPSFTSLDSEYKVASPIMPGMDFTVYGHPVIAEDIDFSNQHVTFTIAPPDDFEIATQSSDVSKLYTAVFKAKRIIQIIGSKEYTITATDSGTDPHTLSTSQTFTLKTDPSSSLDTPTFQATSYSFDYSVAAETCSLSPREGPIVITTNKPDDINKHLTLTGDNIDHFQAVFDASTKTVTISCLRPISPNTSPIAVLYLSVTTDAIATVPLVLYLGDVVADSPSFSSHVYTADYDDTDATVALTNDIVVSPDEAHVNISGSEGTTDFTQYFTLEKASTGYTVKTSRPLPQDVLRSQRSVVLTIGAFLGTSETYAALVINLPVIDQSPAIQFQQVLYNGEYQVVDGTVTFTTDRIEVLTEEDDKNVRVSISQASSYGTYFEASYSSKVVTITQKGLPEDILNKTYVIPLTLEAAVSGTKETTASAVLNIKINYNPAEDTRYLKFNNLLYNGTYKAKDDHSIVTDDIIIDTDQMDDNIEILINNEYNKYFTATYSGKKVTIALSQPVPSAILQSVTVIPILLLAKIKYSTHSTQAILNMRVDDGDGNKGELSLSSFVYNGKYIVEGDKVRIEYDPITVTTDQEDDKIDVEITNGYEKDFKATYSKKAVLVSLSVDSPSKTLLSLANIPVGIKVKIRDSTTEAQAVLNLRVIGDGVIKGELSLSSFVYNGKYKVEGDKVSIEYDPITVITDQEDDKIDVEITNGYEKDFKATYSKKAVLVSLLVDSPSKTLLSLANIPVGIKVSIRDSTTEAQAVLNLRVIGDGDNKGELSLSNFVFNGKYKVEGDKVRLEYDPITVTTDQEDDKIDVEITNGYEKDFKATYSNKAVLVSLLVDSPSKTLLSLANIPVGIKVKIRDSTTEAQAVLNLRVIGDGDNKGELSLSSFVYNGKYIVEGDKVRIEYDPITVTTDQEDDKIDVEITNGYEKDFKATYSNKAVLVSLLVDSPSKTLLSLANIPVGIKVKIRDSTTEAQAVLNLRVIADGDNKGELSLSSFVYNGKYKVEGDKVSIEYDPITVTTDQEDDKIYVEITNGYEKDFKATYSSKAVLVSLLVDSPDKTLLSLANIPVGIKVKIKDSTTEAQAVLNLRVIGDGDKGELSLSNFVYNGKYKVEGDKVRIEYDPITVTTDQEDDKIDVEITNGYEKDFKVTYSKKAVLVSLFVDSPNKTLLSLANIPVGIKVKIRDSTTEAQAVLNLRVIGDGDNKGALSLSNFVYNGKYKVEGDKVRIEYDPITVTTDQEDDKIDVEITNGYEKDFKATYSNKAVLVSLLVDSPSKTLLSLANIPVGIKVKIRDSTTEAQAVLNLRVIGDGDKGELSLSSFVYNGKYKVEGDKVSIEYDPITVTTDQEDDKIDVEITNGYEKDFKATYSSKAVLLSLLVDSPDKTLLSLANIPVGIKVKIRGSTTEAQAVLNLRVIADGDKGELSLSSFVYNGKYKVEGDKVSIEYDPITVTTDQEDDKIDVEITNGYEKDFKATYSKKAVLVSLFVDSPNKTLLSLANIPVGIKVKIRDSTTEAQAVLNLRVIGDINTVKLSLSSFVYNGKYIVDGDKVSIENDPINLTTDQEDEKIEVQITNGYETDFKATYSNKTVLVSLLSDSPSETLLSLQNIPVGIRVKIRDSTTEAQAVLNFRVIGVPDKNDTRTLAFSSILYAGSYSISEGEKEGHFKIDDLQLRTNLMDNELEVTISNEHGYQKYFDVTNTNRLVSVKIKGGVLPEKIVKNTRFIPLTVTAKMIATGDSSYAVLNIDIDYDSDNDDEHKTHHHSVTGYIVAIVVLTILLLGLIGGSAGFYFWKIKGKSYEKMVDSDSNKVTFEQRTSKQSINKERKGSSALEERRPTGFVFRKFDEDGREISSEDPSGGEMMERRKSVAFDDNIEKLQIDSIDDDDIDKALDDETDGDVKDAVDTLA